MSLEIAQPEVPAEAKDVAAAPVAQPYSCDYCGFASKRRMFPAQIKRHEQSKKHRLGGRTEREATKDLLSYYDICALDRENRDMYENILRDVDSAKSPMPELPADSSQNEAWSAAVKERCAKYKALIDDIDVRLAESARKRLEIESSLSDFAKRLLAGEVVANAI